MGPHLTNLSWREILWIEYLSQRFFSKPRRAHQNLRKVENVSNVTIFLEDLNSWGETWQRPWFTVTQILIISASKRSRAQKLEMKVPKRPKLLWYVPLLHTFLEQFNYFFSFPKIFKQHILHMHYHSVWHYRLWIFKTRDTNVERFLHKNQHNQSYPQLLMKKLKN